MGKGTVAKKRSGKTSKTSKTNKADKADNADKKILKDQLDSTGPFILRDFCRQHGMDPDDAKTFPKTKLISFLMGKFKDGELALNDLYPDKGKKSGKAASKSKSKAKAKAKEVEEDLDLDDDDGNDEDDAGDDDLDNDDLDFELDDDGDGDDSDGDDLEDEANGELDDDDGDDLDDNDDDSNDDSDGDGDGPDISIIEDKLDKIIDQNSRIAKVLDGLTQIELEALETQRQALKVQLKIAKVKNPGKLVKQIQQKAREYAGSDNGGDDNLEDE